MSVGRSGMRAEVGLRAANPLSRLVVVVAAAPLRSTTVTAGWVVVLALLTVGLQVPPAQSPAMEMGPQSASVAHESVQTPLAPHVEVAPNAAHCAVAVHAPFWKTPTGPTGEAQVLVT